jgi:hypothetical protein
MIREKRKECFDWGKRSFQRLVSILENHKVRWHSYWVFLALYYEHLEGAILICKASKDSPALLKTVETLKCVIAFYRV